MTPLADEPFTVLLARLGAPRPAPGGGSAAAWACALAAGLVEMAARVGEDPRADRALALRERALELAEADLRSYAPVLRARGDAAALAAALSAASEVPIAVVEAAAETAALAADVARGGRRALEGDAATGALLAEAATRSALRLVEINLADQPDDERLARGRELAWQAAEHRRVALGEASPAP
jgi:formiminotetrahydrofolate cyclodeaminase